jgi:hypothetical protein
MEHDIAKIRLQLIDIEQAILNDLTLSESHVATCLNLLRCSEAHLKLLQVVIHAWQERLGR